MKNFLLIGAAGYIAPRHMKAIRDTGNNLLAAYDPFDSVGILDSYFPGADFFTEFERFDRHVEKLKRNGTSIDYAVVCSPNYLHDAHIRFGLRNGADVICEKPLVLNPWNVSALEEIERETGRRIYNILQLRLHPAVIELKERVAKAPAGGKHEINLTYITSRGNWYFTSWKGEVSKSGGIATNIGIHFFDMLTWIFGDVIVSETHLNEHDRAAGFLELENANVRWFLSINADTLPAEVREKGLRTYRSLRIGDDEFEFSGGFEDLHTVSYREILEGNGFPVSETMRSIEIVHKIRNSEPIGSGANSHELLSLPLSVHPFKK
ncbi:MAG: Gfo/Idh/MocA family oxidoreductase [Pyrinomonadaceae bacterium]